MQVAFLCNSADNLNNIYGPERRTRFPQASLFPEDLTENNLGQYAGKLNEIEAIFSTWGMPALSPALLDLLPNLKVVFYGAGSVKGFAKPLMERGIRVISAWQANGVAVAEFSFAHILLAGKGYLRSARIYSGGASCRDAAHDAVAGGNYKTTVALLGAGAIGRRVLQMLKRETLLNVLLYDPYLTDEAATAMGAKKATLEECFEQAQVVSNHVPSLPETKQLVRGEHLRRLPHNATFLNTGRGATVHEEEMIAVLQDRPDITAILDVTHPEPPVADSPLYTLPNVFLTPHIAGTMNTEWRLMGDNMLEEFARWQSGQPFTAEVTLAMLDKMA